MNSIDLKNKLEKYFKVDFNVLDENNAHETFFNIYNNKEGFHIISEIVGNDILIVKGEPQEMGANFLRTINNSNANKRLNSVSLLSSFKNNIKLLINNREIEINNFITDNEKWESFEIIYQRIPFDKNNDNEYFEIIKLFVNLFLSLVDYSIEGFEEGNRREDKTIRYERNHINRQICLNHKGHKCLICGFDFEKVYGEMGKDEIEVHHIREISNSEKSHMIDPINDLIPVCSNCHTMLHSRKPSLTPDELRGIISKTRNNL